MEIMIMETLSFQQVIIAAGVAFLIFFFTTLWISRTSTTKKKRGANYSTVPPEVPGRWPVIGHLHKLGGSQQPLMRTLGELADKYGPLITLWIGTAKRTIVVSSWELAKECYTTSDKALATRPRSAADPKYVAFSPYGNLWRESRKIATIHLLSNRQIELLKHVRAEEVRLAIKDLFQGWNKIKVPFRVEMKGWFENLVFNNFMMSVFGKRCDKDEMEARKFRELLNTLSLLLGTLIPSDAIPILKWFDIGGYVRSTKKTMKELDSLCSIWLEDHRLLRQRSNNIGPDQDFIDVLLTILEKSPFPESDPNTSVKTLTLSVILAANDTSTITLAWALSLLLNNRSALKKAQEELDTHVGRDRNVNEDDIPHLPYLQAIVKETLRLYPAAPLALPHEAMEDCYVGGFRITAGTRVLINIWKIHRDPSIWSDPHKFMPERFLTTNVDTDLRGQHFELIPFGAGRRMCPGISFALKLLHFVLARLLHAFDLQTPSDEPVDMTEAMGLGIPKASSLEVTLVPRLSSDLYL